MAVFFQKNCAYFEKLGHHGKNRSLLGASEYNCEIGWNRQCPPQNFTILVVDRSRAPWGAPLRHPSHEECRRYLRRRILDKEYHDALDLASIPQIIITLLKK